MSKAKDAAQQKLIAGDESNGWQSATEDFETYRNAEKARDTIARAAVKEAAANEREWRGLMWLWARRARRDIIILEETLRKLAEQTGFALDPKAFYGDPGDPPPPPPEDW
jgi:hypothetical protein